MIDAERGRLLAQREAAKDELRRLKTDLASVGAELLALGALLQEHPERVALANLSSRLELLQKGWFGDSIRRLNDVDGEIIRLTCLLEEL